MPRDLKARVLSYLEARRGERVYLSQMQKDLNESARRLQSSISFIKLQGTLPITPVVRGHTWDIGAEESVEPGSDTRNKYTEIATLKSGAFLIERQDGALFVANLTEVE